MCYLLSISEQNPGIFGDIDELVYVKYQLNIATDCIQQDIVLHILNTR